MGDSATGRVRLLGPTLGKVTAWRDRGTLYTDGLRTSGQFALIGAGVAKGAGFTDAHAAILFGAAIFVGIELLKVCAGWLDYRHGGMAEYLRVTGEADPVRMRMVHALERMAK